MLQFIGWFTAGCGTAMEFTGFGAWLTLLDGALLPASKLGIRTNHGGKMDILLSLPILEAHLSKDGIQIAGQGSVGGKVYTAVGSFDVPTQMLHCLIVDQTGAKIKEFSGKAVPPSNVYVFGGQDYDFVAVPKETV